MPPFLVPSGRAAGGVWRAFTEFEMCLSSELLSSELLSSELHWSLTVLKGGGVTVTSRIGCERVPAEFPLRVPPPPPLVAVISDRGGRGGFESYT